MGDADSMDFMEKFIHDNPVPKDAIQHFSSISWTRNYLQDHVYKTIPTFSRVLKPTGEDYFFSRTVNTPQTIPHLVTLQLKNLKSPPETPRGSPIKKVSHTSATQVPEKPDTIMLLQLAKTGLDGHPSVVHGGMVCAILDEMMGLCVMLHHQHLSGPRDALFTVNLNVTYRAPVHTPGVILVRCWLTARQGRKWYSIGQIVNEDGLVLSEGEGTWVLASREKL